MSNWHTIECRRAYIKFDYHSRMFCQSEKIADDPTERRSPTTKLFFRLSTEYHYYGGYYAHTKMKAFCAPEVINPRSHKEYLEIRKKMLTVEKALSV